MDFELKNNLDNIMKKLHIQPVGNGYIDLICPVKKIGEFIDCMEQLGIKIKGFTWWCHVHDSHPACGLGGPQSQYSDGWFSEIPANEITYFESNDKLKQYLLEDYPNCPQYKECYVPAFWLDLD
ncbi:MAG: hypothetical protein K2K17_11065 [Lachnospiraceae bacterium]|nr:hypothetical protein [Lachnospiraceae bacterium]